MNTDLFTSLRKYRPKDGRDARENFITEAFAWLLRNNEDFSNYFIKKIFDELDIKTKAPSNTQLISPAKWITQTRWDGKIPDMICEINKSVLIFEHKTQTSDLGSDQLANYKKYASNKYLSHYVIIITASKNQHHSNQPYDLGLCWSDIYLYIRDWIEDGNCKIEYLVIFQSFLTLLAEENMHYYSSDDFKQETRLLADELFKYNWNYIVKKDDYNPERSDAWGRHGFTLFSRPWKPTIFIGFMIDGKDHKTTPVLNKISPDFVVIISFIYELRKDYSQNILYKNLVSKLSEKIKILNENLDFYNHLEDQNKTEHNLFHPIHIRKPVIELFKNSKTHIEKINKCIDLSSKVLNVIMECDEFMELRNEYSKRLKPNGKEYILS